MVEHINAGVAVNVLLDELKSGESKTYFAVPQIGRLRPDLGVKFMIKRLN